MNRSIALSGQEKYNSAKKEIEKGEYDRAIVLLTESIVKFNSAINTAKLNCQGNYIPKYQENMNIVYKLLKKIRTSAFHKNEKKEQNHEKQGIHREKGNDKTDEVKKPRLNEQPKSENTQDHENYQEINPGQPEETMHDTAEDKQENDETNGFEDNDPKEQQESENTQDHENYQEINPGQPEDPNPDISEEEQKISEPEEEQADYNLSDEQLSKNPNDMSGVYNDILVNFGKDESGNIIQWKPKLLANQHLACVGMSGTGKTTALRTIIHQLEKQDVPLIIFDLHDDFNARKVINFSDITINPLELDGLTPKEKAIEFAYICKRIFRLGDQQENKLREAIIHAYGLKGIDLLDKSTYSRPAPTLADINDILENNRDGKTIDTLLGRIKFFHRVELFMSETRCPFYDMFTGSTVIKLIEFSDNPDLQTALCEIFLNKLLFNVKKAGQSQLRAYCVIDEAHILDDGKDSYRSPLVKIAREARKYGLGLILASQMPKDFSKSVLHNTATIMSLKFNAKEEAKAVSDQMFGVSETDILNLGEIGQGYVKLGSEVKTVNFFQKDDIL